MRNKTERYLKRKFTIRYCMLLAVLIMGCAGPQVMTPQAPPSARFPSFVAVTVQDDDTLSSLASRYLGDSSKDWLISDFNDVSFIRPGQ